MSISGQNLSIVIVTLKSENVIHQCIGSIDKNIPIVVIENSNNSKFKEDLEKRYSNVKCTLSNENLGMGRGNNLGLKLTSTDYVFIINPDVVFEHDTINEIIQASKILSNFTILSPVLADKNYPNYELINNKDEFNEKNILKVNNVDGFAMLFNTKKLDEIINNESSNTNNTYFDENFFMYLENNDLCKRVINANGKIYVSTKAKINHLGGKAVDKKYADEIELSRNWHWIWSKYYFNKKHFGFTKAFFYGFPKFCSSILKCIFFLIINNKIKRKIYFNRVSGFVNAFFGNSSWYRPKFND